MVDWNSLAKRKYDLIEKGIDARNQQMPMPMGLRPTGSIEQGGGGLDIDPLELEKRDLLKAQTADAMSQAGYRQGLLGVERAKLAQQAKAARDARLFATWDTYGDGGLSREEAEDADQAFKKGKAVVRPKGMGLKAALKASGKKDTVPAKLATGEAVLNKAAADMLGRGMIAKLNAKGALKMGLT